jgi:putative nucleotidyltransferase with HDIG domain
MHLLKINHHFFQLFFPVILLIVVGGYYFGKGEIERELNNVEFQQKLGVGLGTGALRGALKDIVRDLKYLSVFNSLKRAIDNPTTEHMTYLEQAFAHFSRSKQIYDQIRWLDEAGHERVRVDLKSGQPVIIQNEKLQNKGKRYYFADSFNLDSGEIFVSPLDLNIEQGQIELPYKPMIRIATPVTDSNGVKRGVVLLNYYGREMLDDFAQRTAGIKDHAMVLNREGYWLKSPSTKDEWGFMFKNLELSFSSRFPEAWKEIVKKQTGQVRMHAGLLTWQTVYPLNAGLRSSSGSADAFKPSRSKIKTAEYFWKVVSFVPDSSLAELTHVVWMKISFTGMVLLTLMGLGSWKLANAWNRQEQAEFEVRQMNATLEERVAERTQEIKELYSREHYLKGLLSTISEINETLIQTFSMGSVIEPCLDKLKRHTSYRLILLGNFDGKYLNLNYILGDQYALLDQREIALEELNERPLLRSTAKAIASRHWEVDDGFDFRKLKKTRNHSGDYDLQASISFPLIDPEDGGVMPLLCFWTDRKQGFDREEIRILDTVAQDINMAASAYKHRQLNEALHKEHIKNYEETILAFVDMIEQRDAYTAGHTLRVAKYSRLIAEHMQLDNASIFKLEKAAILHDIGKIATPDNTLLKPGQLTRLEYNLIQNHVMTGYKVLSKVKMYADLAEIIRYHHEWYDGTGYPTGIKGQEIPIESQVLVVADAFDAMTTNRIYRGRMSVTEAMQEMKKNSGSQFSPYVVAAAVNVLSGVKIEMTTQLPKNALEKQRFSYFFNDNLTGLYNASYLYLLLNNEREYYCVHLVTLKKFSNFNREYGWNKGNELVRAVANQLQMRCPSSLLFRIQGDDFLILSRKHIQFDEKSIRLSFLDPKNILSIQSSYLDIRDRENNERLRELLYLSINPASK